MADDAPPVGDSGNLVYDVLWELWNCVTFGGAEVERTQRYLDGPEP